MKVTLDTLSNVLNSTKKDSNNYGYGFQNFSSSSFNKRAGDVDENNTYIDAIRESIQEYLSRKK